jgi:hypothetical protein
MLRVAVGAGVLLVLASVLGLSGTLGVGGEVLGRLVIGWVMYLNRVLPRIRISWDGVTTALVCLAALMAGLHFFLRWLHGEIGRARAPLNSITPRWRFRRTAAIVAVVVLMFAAGISFVGVAHQVGWLVASKKSLLGQRIIARGAPPEFNLKEIGLALSCYASAQEDRLPMNAVGREGRALHSWQTVIVPYTWQRIDAVHYDLPWDHPRNSAIFRGIVQFYLNPQVGALRDSRGYALSHYAGNVHVFSSHAMPEIHGLSTTILAGEVADGFLAWGNPHNLRDPALGLTSDRSTFGNTERTGAYFLLGDGSVRFLRDTTDRKILSELSIPKLSLAQGHE